VRALRAVGDRLYVGGNFGSIGGVSQARGAAIDLTSGSVVTAFAPSFDNTVMAVTASPDGQQVYFGGDFLTVNGASHPYLVRVDRDGAAAPTLFDAPDGYAISGLDMDDSGSRLFASIMGAGNQAASFDINSGRRLWRVRADGDVQAVAYHQDNVYFGFHEGMGGNPDLRIAAADAQTGEVESAFLPPINSFWGVWALDATDRGVLAGGDFTVIDSVQAQRVAFFDARLGTPAPRRTTIAGLTTSWRYFDGAQAPSGWREPSFDDSAWATGVPELGYGEGDESTVISYGPDASNKPIASYYRTSVQWDGSHAANSLVARLLADDAAIVYLNGVEVVRDNLPAGAIEPTTRALLGRSGAEETMVRDFAIDPRLLRVGANEVAVELHQESRSTSDASLRLTLQVSDEGATTAAAPVARARLSASDGLTVSLDGSGSSDADGTVVSWQWDLGDGSTTSGETVEHAFAQAGTYRVSLTVTDDAGLTGRSELEVSVALPGEGPGRTDLAGPATRWRYFDQGQAPASWAAPGFDASSWKEGLGQFGYGDGDEVTVVEFGGDPQNRHRTTYFRTSVHWDAAHAAENLLVRLLADDGAVVYLNGAEVVRDNMPAGAIDFGTYASTGRWGTQEQAWRDFTLDPSLLRVGENTIAVEVHQNSGSSNDLSFDLGLIVSSP
jgi:hypothetical protein